MMTLTQQEIETLADNILPQVIAALVQPDQPARA